MHSHSWQSKRVNSVNALTVFFSTMTGTLNLIDIGGTGNITPFSCEASVTGADINVHPIYTVSVLPTNHSHAVIMAGYREVTPAVSVFALEVAVLTVVVLHTHHSKADGNV